MKQNLMLGHENTPMNENEIAKRDFITDLNFIKKKIYIYIYLIHISLSKL